MTQIDRRAALLSLATASVAIPAILTADELSEVRGILDRAAWSDGRSTAGHRARTVKNNLQLAADLPEARQLAEFVADRLARNPTFLSAALPLRLVPPRFNRYEHGGEAPPERDWQAMNEQDHANQQDRPATDAVAVMMATHSSLMHTLRKYGDQDLTWAIGDFKDHYDEHAAQVREWRQQKGIPV